MAVAINQDTMTPIYQLIGSQLGIQVKPVDEVRINQWVEKQLARRRMSLSDLILSLDAAQWQGLVECVTNNESFFFRDDGLFALLQAKILPELIEKNRDSRRICIWSAAASRGEEIYSIAILLRELIPDYHRWQLQLFGTDVNEKVIGTARAGSYSEWSLRALTQQRREAYFTRQRNDWQLVTDIRNMVTFAPLNLVSDDYSKKHHWLRDVDLILCRNVFIYFSQSAIESTVHKLTQTLKLGGILVTGHAELSAKATRELTQEMLPGSLLYRRSAPSAAEPVMFAKVEVPAVAVTGIHKPLRKPLTPTSPRRAESRRINPMFTSSASVEPVVSRETDSGVAALSQALEQFGQTRYHEAIDTLAKRPRDDAVIELNSLKLEAQCWTNLGDYTKAADSAQKASVLDPFSAELFYLLAHISELQGDTPAAIQSLEKAIYLDGEFIPAYIDLSALLELAQRNKRSQRLRVTASNLLAKLPADSEVFPYIGVTVTDLINYLSELANTERNAS